MNALLRITIRVNTANSAELKRIQAELRALQAAAAQTAGRMGFFDTMRAGAAKAVSSISSLASWFGNLARAAGTGLINIGKDLQWTGRQLEFRFTLPVIAAGAAATKFALDNERALTRVRKVYGDTTMSMEEVNREVDALSRSFRALSDIFGVHQSEVIEIAAVWAQAGARGVELAKGVRATLETMILGEVDAAKATQALITIMHTYRLTAEELTGTLATLNMIENETTANFTDLIEVIQDAGGVARVAGVDIRHLAAMTAALVPAAGSASEVGNSLKTTIARIMAPTDQAAEAFARLGINVQSMDWQSANFVERLEMLAAGYDNLSQSQKLQFARDVAQLRQISRLAILLDDLTSSQSRYRAALDATADSSANLQQFHREIGIFLSSTPQAFQILTTRLQNFMAEAIVPLLPAIQAVLADVTRLVQKFTELDPSTQKTILTFIALGAAMGPVIAYAGAFLVAIGSIVKMLGPVVAALEWVAGVMIALLTRAIIPLISSGLTALATALGVPVSVAALLVAALVAAGAAAYAFRDQIGRAFSAVAQAVSRPLSAVLNAIGTAFTGGVRIAVTALSALPRAVSNIFSAVIRIIASAARAFYQWLSYFNPFARHSPSLVEQVQAGVDLIIAQYARLGQVGQIIRDAATDLQAFMNATAAARESLQAAAHAENIKAISSFGPEVVAAYERAASTVTVLREELDKVGDELKFQQAVVDEWNRKLDEANEKVKSGENFLKRLEKDAKDLEDQLNAAKNRMSDLASMGIEGYGAMSDAIFENEQAQKRLELAIAQTKLAGGSTEDLEKQLEVLREQGNILRLQRDIEFDPKQRQIDMLVNPRQEMSFDDIISGIERERELIDSLQPQVDAAKEKVRQQELVVEGLRAERDEIERIRDAEQKELDAIQERYDAIEQQINDMTSAMDEFVSSAQQAAKALEGAGGGAGGGGGLGPPGDFEIPGGMGGGPLDIGDGNIDEINALTEQWMAEAEGMFSGVGLDIEGWFGKLKSKVTGGLTGLRDAIIGFPGRLGEWLYDKLGLDSLANVVATIGGWLSPIVSAIGGFFGGVLNAISPFTNVIAGAVEAVFGAFKGDGLLGQIVGAIPGLVSDAFNGIVTAWNTIMESEFMERVGRMLSAVSEAFFSIFSDVAETVDYYLRLAFDVLVPWAALFYSIIEAMLNRVGAVWQIAWDTIVSVFKVAWATIEGAWNVFYAAFWPVLQQAFDAIVDMAKRLWDDFMIVWEGITKVVEGTLDIIRGTVKTFFALFRGDWDAFWEGIRIAWDGFWTLMRGLLEFTLGNLKVLFDIFLGSVEYVWKLILGAIEGAKDGILAAFRAIYDIGQTIFDSISRLVYSTWTAIWQTMSTAGTLIKDAIGGAFRSLWSLVRDPLNTVIGIINTFISGVNWVITKFGVGAIPHIPTLGGSAPSNGWGGADPYREFQAGMGMASGGAIPVGDGMRVNRPTVVVGEGSRSWPEYVIPTDPRYRDRALALLTAAASRIGGFPTEMARGGVIGPQGLPQMFLGGIIGDAWDALKGAAKTVAKASLRAALAVPSKAFDLAVGAVPEFSEWVRVAKNAVIDVKNKAYTWAVNLGDVSIDDFIDSGKGLNPGNIIPKDRIPSALHGALARHRAGGSLVRVAEGNQDEAIVPLPRGLRPDSLGGGTTVNIYGDLSFPNITDPDDAENFIRNLEALAS